MDASLTYLPPSSWTILPPPPPLTFTSTDCAAPTKIFQPDKAHCNESNTCHNSHVPSHNRWHQPAPLSATDPTVCRLIPLWSPRPPPPVVGGKLSVLDGADSSFHFEAMFSFLRAVVGFSLGCVAYALRSLPSHFNAVKRPRTRRIPAFALVALSIATAPWSVHSQVDNCEK